jgi:hypothetical protein
MWRWCFGPTPAEKRREDRIVAIMVAFIAIAYFSVQVAAVLVARAIIGS